MLGSKLGQQAAAVLPPKGPNFAAKGEELERGGRNVGHGYDGGSPIGFGRLDIPTLWGWHRRRIRRPDGGEVGEEAEGGPRQDCREGLRHP
ncbi:hypothetical protein ZIOFF_025717 [Zingiber officinale]|uniref:Uncharacterized protein n=1 Tax=Zingiber officinale TaxID=94328 RepID=A0A8J5L708_ZINOF|nr:hypothetical protein ZIOFF_025717 [Zingiber officinale]